MYGLGGLKFSWLLKFSCHLVPSSKALVSQIARMEKVETRIAQNGKIIWPVQFFLAACIGPVQKLPHTPYAPPPCIPAQVMHSATTPKPGGAGLNLDPTPQTR